MYMCFTDIVNEPHLLIGSNGMRLSNPTFVLSKPTCVVVLDQGLKKYTTYDEK